MSWSYTIGRIAGVDLKMHATFPLLLLWVIVPYRGILPTIVSLAFVLTLFACVVLHEFGHILMARHYGIHTHDVILLPIGGVARLVNFPTRPRQEFFIAVAGPAVTLAIALVLGVVLTISHQGPTLERLTYLGSGFLANLLVVNVYILLFNLIPAFPMDGGRVLRSILASRFGFRRGTRIAATVGRGFAILFALYALFGGPSPNFFLLLIALFVFVSASGEAAAVQAREMPGDHQGPA